MDALTRLVQGIAAAMGLGTVLAAGLLSGVVGMKASTGHWAATEAVLGLAMRRSVAMRALGTEVPPLDDPGLVALGAGHYDRWCAPCHGTPGAWRPAAVREMLPPPPPLDDVEDLGQAAFVVEHGLRFTGMPGWPDQRRTDEIWPLVALVDAFGRGLDADGDAALVAVPPDAPEALRACVACHGTDGEAGAGGRIPRLAGQRVEYLVASLDAYAAGRRASGIMGPVADRLTAAQRREAAEHYARQPRPAPSATRSGRGEDIARHGIPDDWAPPCGPCHGPRALGVGEHPRYPVLDGQPPAYLEAQLRLFREGRRGAAPGRPHGGGRGARPRRSGDRGSRGLLRLPVGIPTRHGRPGPDPPAPRARAPGPPCARRRARAGAPLAAPRRARRGGGAEGGPGRGLGGGDGRGAAGAGRGAAAPARFPGAPLAVEGVHGAEAATVEGEGGSFRIRAPALGVARVVADELTLEGLALEGLDATLRTEGGIVPVLRDLLERREAPGVSVEVTIDRVRVARLKHPAAGLEVDDLVLRGVVLEVGGPITAEVGTSTAGRVVAGVATLQDVRADALHLALGEALRCEAPTAVGALAAPGIEAASGSVDGLLVEDDGQVVATASSVALAGVALTDGTRRAHLQAATLGTLVLERSPRGRARC
ncbi:MAG: c-type cytochrome [Myxococcota bacterium]